jgi:hypothetical protein
MGFCEHGNIFSGSLNGVYTYGLFFDVAGVKRKVIDKYCNSLELI